MLGAFSMHIWAALSLLLPFCASLAAAPMDAEMGQGQTIDRFAYDGPSFLKGCDTENQIRELGKIRSAISKKEINIYDGTPLFVKRLVFVNGLEVNFRSFGSPPRAQLTSVFVTSPKWPIEHGLSVGARADTVIEALGRPTKKADDQIEYLGETERVVFSVDHGVITEILFDYYYE